MSKDPDDEYETKHYDTIPVRPSTLDTMLRTLHDIETRVHAALGDFGERLARQEAVFAAYVAKVDSDIKDLRGSGRRMLDSSTNLEKQLLEEKLAEVQRSRAAWMSWVIKVGTSVLVAALVGVAGWIIGRGGVK